MAEEYKVRFKMAKICFAQSNLSMCQQVQMCTIDAIECFDSLNALTA